MKNRKDYNGCLHLAKNADGELSCKHKVHHTPGPWYVEGGWLIFQGGEMLAEAYSHKDIQGISEANARLIAAAPELLEHLQNLHGMLTQGGKHYMGEEITKRLVRKAEGRS